MYTLAPADLVMRGLILDKEKGNLVKVCVSRSSFPISYSLESALAMFSFVCSACTAATIDTLCLGEVTGPSCFP